MTTPANPMVQELRDSVAFIAGQGHERRNIAELLRARASNLQILADAFPSNASYRMTLAELRRMADQLEAMP